MTEARHAANVGAWVILVSACLVPIIALLIAPFDHEAATAPAVAERPATTTTTAVPASSTSASSTGAPVHVTPGSLTEANDQGDPTFVPGEGGTWRTGSTFYCLPGTTADGSGVADGIVAVSYANWSRLRGTSWQVVTGPPDLVGRTFTVHDKGPRAEFDIWTADCGYARAYGRRTITVVPA